MQYEPKINVKDCTFDGTYDSEIDNMTVAFFVAPVELLQGRYPDAVSAEICVTFPRGDPNPGKTDVMISPTRMTPADEFEDYDWSNIFPDEKVVEGLVVLYVERMKMLDSKEEKK